MQIHPKVTSNSAGMTYGGALTVIVFWLLQGVFGVSPDQFTTERTVAVTLAIGVPIGFLAGYMTSSPPQPELPPPGGSQ